MATALRRVARFKSPRREAWYGIGEFASMDRDIVCNVIYLFSNMIRRLIEI